MSIGLLTAVRNAARVLAFLVSVTTAGAFQLVTEQDAALPNDELPVLVKRGGPTRRPQILVISPAPNAGLVKSPLNLKIKFEAFGGAKIDVTSIIMTYKKKDHPINLTQHIAPFITAVGIEIADVEMPVGTHVFWIELNDNDGRKGRSEFIIGVTK